MNNTPTLEVVDGRLLCDGVELGTIELDEFGSGQSVFCSSVYPRVICRDVEEFRRMCLVKPTWVLQAAQNCLNNNTEIIYHAMQQLNKNQHEGIRDELKRVDSWMVVSKAWLSLVRH